MIQLSIIGIIEERIKMSNLWNREPVMFMAVIQAWSCIECKFWITLSAEQVGGIMTLVQLFLIHCSY